MSKTLRFLDAGRCLVRLCLFALLLAAAMLPAAPAMAEEKQSQLNPTLQEALKCKAPEIRAFLWKEMVHPEESLHVGVIKFLVKLGDQPPSDNAGPLNWYIARRLEAALILTLKPNTKEAHAFRILHIDTLSKDLMGKVNHLKPEGRRAFFQTQYSPAWGQENTLPAHVFLTGLVTVPDGARTMKVEVQAFDNTGKEPVKVCCFEVAAQPRLITEAGVSFALSRGAPHQDNTAWVEHKLPTEATVVVSNPVKPREKARESETILNLLNKAPIDFQIEYKNKGENEFRKVEIEENGTVPEPEEGTKVRFQLKRRKDKDTNSAYGVLLMVNGENTIYREPVSDYSRAHLWILDKDDDKPTFVTGFLKKGPDNEVAEFEVLSAAESQAMEVNYGRHVGTLTIVIFQGQIDGKEEPGPKETEFVRAISFGVPDKLAKPNGLKALQDSLQKTASLKTKKSKDVVSRGLIVEGNITKQDVQDVPFRSRVPVSSIQLRYYKPQSRD